MDAAHIGTTRKVHRKELNSVAKKAGITHQTCAALVGIKQHWVGEVHKEDGAQMNTHDNSSVDYTKELANTMSMLINSGGAMTALDEVSIAELVPQGVQEARKLEIHIF